MWVCAKTPCFQVFLCLMSILVAELLLQELPDMGWICLNEPNFWAIMNYYVSFFQLIVGICKTIDFQLFFMSNVLLWFICTSSLVLFRDNFSYFSCASWIFQIWLRYLHLTTAKDIWLKYGVQWFVWDQIACIYFSCASWILCDDRIQWCLVMLGREPSPYGIFIFLLPMVYFAPFTS